jgi:hypothetical protein
VKDRKVKQVLSGGWYQWNGEGIRKGYRRVNTRMYFVYMYGNRTMKPVEIVLRRVKEGSGRILEGMI